MERRRHTLLPQVAARTHTRRRRGRGRHARSAGAGTHASLGALGHSRGCSGVARWLLVLRRVRRLLLLLLVVLVLLLRVAALRGAPRDGLRVVWVLLLRRRTPLLLRRRAPLLLRRLLLLLVIRVRHRRRLGA